MLKKSKVSKASFMVSFLEVLREERVEQALPGLSPLEEAKE